MLLGIALTEHCNLRCPHCIRDDVTTVRNLDAGLVLRTLDEGRELWGSVAASFTGGEPTLHPEWERIIQGVHERGMTYRFVSNGWHMRRLMPALDRYPPARVRLSLSGADEAVHDAERGRGSFRRVLLSVALLTSRRIPTSLAFLADRRDRHQLRAAADLAEALGCLSIDFALAQPVPGSAARDSDLSPREWYAVRDEIHALAAEGRRTRVGLDYGAPFDGPERPCDTFAAKRVYIDARGQLSLCCQLSEYGFNQADVVADLNHTPLAEAWPRYVAALEALRAASAPRGDHPLDPFPCIRCARSLGKTSWLADHPASPWAGAASAPAPARPALVKLRRSPAARAVQAIALAVACGAATACGGGSGGGGPVDPPGQTLTVEVTGRAERGSVVRLRVLRAGTALAGGAAALAFTPADAAQALGGDSVKLLRAGALSVRATSGADAGTHDLTVATPPSVVFDRVAEGNRDIWRVALDGGDLARLTTDPAEDSEPTAAAGRVAFMSRRADRNGEIFSMAIAGGEATRLTRTAGDEATPTLSPNGQRIAYTYDGTGIGKLWLAAADGSAAAVAAPSFGTAYSIDASPTWAADGSRIAFTSTAHDGTADVFALPVPGSPALLAGGRSAEVEGALSPDGASLAFASDRGGGGVARLHLLNVASGAVTRLTAGTAAEGHPAWTTDGRLVYVEYGPGGGKLRWIDPAAPGTVHPIETGTGSARNPARIP